jgi:hypothetical protein
MEPYPGEMILSSDAAFVEGLMLMPDKRDVEGIRHKRWGDIS